MARRLLRDEGLFVGGSAAMNCVGVLRAAEVLPPGSTIVTVLRRLDILLRCLRPPHAQLASLVMMRLRTARP